MLLRERTIADYKGDRSTTMHRRLIDCRYWLFRTWLTQKAEVNAQLLSRASTKVGLIGHYVPLIRPRLPSGVVQASYNGGVKFKAREVCPMSEIDFAVERFASRDAAR